MNDGREPTEDRKEQQQISHAKMSSNENESTPLTRTGRVCNYRSLEQLLFGVIIIIIILFVYGSHKIDY